MRVTIALSKKLKHKSPHDLQKQKQKDSNHHTRNRKVIVAGNANCSWFEPYQLQTVHDLAEFVVRQIRQKSHADGKQTHKQTTNKVKPGLFHI